MIDHQRMGRKALGKTRGSDSPKSRPKRMKRTHRKAVLSNAQQLRYQNDADGSFAWVAANAGALYEKYPDRWILVDKAQVVDSAVDPEDLLRLARTLRIKEPFATMTTPPELPGRSIYAGKVF